MQLCWTHEILVNAWWSQQEGTKFWTWTDESLIGPMKIWTLMHKSLCARVSPFWTFWKYWFLSGTSNWERFENRHLTRAGTPCNLLCCRRANKVTCGFIHKFYILRVKFWNKFESYIELTQCSFKIGFRIRLVNFKICKWNHMLLSNNQKNSISITQIYDRWSNYNLIQLI